MDKGWCSWCDCECVIVRPEHFEDKSMDTRITIMCNGKKHDPTPSVVFKTQEDWIKYKIMNLKRELESYEKRLWCLNPQQGVSK